MRTTPGMKVNYVTADEKVTTATVIEPLGDSFARLDVSGDGKHTAIAEFNDDKKTPNTFHAFGRQPKTAEASK